jgi:hypothetical protein
MNSSKLFFFFLSFSALHKLPMMVANHLNMPDEGLVGVSIGPVAGSTPSHTRQIMMPAYPLALRGG